jgi:ferrous iron transport protein A
MKDVTTLDRLAVGQRAAVTEVSAPEDQRRRLQELGFVPGGVVSAVQESPWGDPVAYAVCGAVIALRRADARQIAVRQR